MFEGSEVRQIKMLDKLESSYGKPSMDCVVMMNMESYKDLKHIQWVKREDFMTDR